MLLAGAGRGLGDVELVEDGPAGGADDRQGVEAEAAEAVIEVPGQGVAGAAVGALADHAPGYRVGGAPGRAGPVGAVELGQVGRRLRVAFDIGDASRVGGRGRPGADTSRLARLTSLL